MYDELYKENAKRDLYKDAKKKLKEKKNENKLRTSISSLLKILDIPSSSFYKNVIVNKEKINRKTLVDNCVRQAYSLHELNTNLGRQGILSIVQEINPTISEKDVRKSKERLNIKCTKVFFKLKPTESKDINARVPNLLNGATKMNVPLQAFSSDTTAMYTIDSSNK
jgi:hypothetical protein